MPNLSPFLLKNADILTLFIDRQSNFETNKVKKAPKRVFVFDYFRRFDYLCR